MPQKRHSLKNLDSIWGDIMKINKRKLSDFEAYLNSFTYGSSIIENDIYNSGMNHILLSQRITPQSRELTVTFQSEKDISKFTSLMVGHIEIDTEDGFLYDCILSATPDVEHIGCDYYKVTYPLSAIKKGRRKKITLSYPSTMKLIVGDIMTLPIITIIPKKDISSVNVLGSTIRNLITNKKIVIDSVSKTVEQDGQNKFGDTDLKRWPIIETGKQTLSVNSPDIEVIVEYDPLYL